MKKASSARQKDRPRDFRNVLGSRCAIIVTISALIAASVAVYLPGVSGPYLFDDYTNLLDNSYVKLKSLDLDALYRASFSLAAGPLQRPVAMASFAINHYFAGSFATTTSFKLTNVFIHLLNGLLVFWLCRLMFMRYAETAGQAPNAVTLNGHTQTILAGTVALLWTVHPMQVTSVLYVVQRMTELSALFTLLAVTCYFKARFRALSGINFGSALWLGAGLLFGILAIFSKENALLIPLFLLVIEFAFFSNTWPWTAWPKLPSTWRRNLLIGFFVIVISGAALFVLISLPYYGVRNFTPTERLLTEARVVIFYLSLILAPRINAFGLLHDDIPISTSLWAPWTTVPAILCIAVLIVVAVSFRRKHVLVSFGIAWFFVAHLLESTIFPLEIAHEHRNYVATFGVIVAIVYGIAFLASMTKRPAWFLLLPITALIFGLTTYARAIQWSEPESFYRYEALHHPRSPGAQMSYGMVLYEQRSYDEAMLKFRSAAELDPREAGLLINMLARTASLGREVSIADQQETVRRLERGPVTATGVWALKNVSGCIFDKCRSLAPLMEEWLVTLLNRPPRAGDDRSFYNYLLARTLSAQGKYNDAILAYRRSYELDPNYLHPLLELGALFVNIGRPDYANVILAEIHRKNSVSLYPKNKEVAELETMIAGARKGR